MDVRKSAMVALKDCMGIKPEENVLIITDSVRKDLGVPVYETALEIGCDAMYMEMKPRSRSGEEPPYVVAQAMKSADVIIAITKVSLSHTQARKVACKLGARCASIPVQDSDSELVRKMFATGGMTADYRAMEKKIDQLFTVLNECKMVGIKTDLGTDATFRTDRLKWHSDTGFALMPGDFTNLPGGEIFTAPDSATGTVVIDGSFGDFGLLKNPITLTLKNGSCIDAKGEKADELNAMFDLMGKDARNVAELGIGMNPKAKLWGILLEDEKCGNTIHVALGDNSGFGGTVSVPMHYDGIVTKPAIYLDGERLDLFRYI